jgi:hypothetical protein
MDTAWEGTFRAWAKPLGQTEADRCDNAERMVRKAIGSSDALKARATRVFAQGSYRNNTNVRQDSDVDICVLCTDTIIFDLDEGVTREQTGWTPATYSFTDYRNDVDRALRSYFGADGVKRGNKAFDVHANTYHVDADVVACFEYRYYYRLTSGGIGHNTGTAFYSDSGAKVHNYPEQHYREGVAKNEATSDRFKKVVRILKRMRGKMEEENIAAGKCAPSFFIESLVWNTPNGYFGNEQYADDVRNAITLIYNATSSDDKCKDWTEVNALKYLFRAAQPWTRQQANDFALAAWQYVGFTT